MVAVSAAAQLESASERSKLPLYKTLPAAKDSELTAAIETGTASSGWSRSNADAANTRYSALRQINRGNVARLEVAWEYRSGETGVNNIQANPVIVDGVMYAPAVGGMIVALNAATGRELWRFKPPAATESFGENYGPAHRGLMYWPGTEDSAPRLFFTASGSLFALNPTDGKPVEAFGTQGRVPARGPVAPVIYQDRIVASDLGAVEAFGVISGQPLWRFEIHAQSQGPLRAARPGEHYYPGGSVWGGAMALDEVRGLIFFSTGAPHPNFVGVDRPGNNEHTNSIVALDAWSGKFRWAFQDIAHDLWDLDIPAPPNLITVTHRGRRVDAVAQVTKQGNTLLLDRVTGKPLFPFRLRRAPVSTVPGERAASYQPDLQLPQPFSRQTFTREDITHRTPQAREFVARKLSGAVLGWFEPPREDRPVAYYGVHGGAEWTGAAVDAKAGVLYVSANEIAWLAWVTRAAVPQSSAAVDADPGHALFKQWCAGCHGAHREGKGVAPSLLGIKRRLNPAQVEDILTNGRGGMLPIPLPDQDRGQLVSFLFQNTTGPTKFVDGGLEKLLDDAGYPGNTPPWGTLNALDLNSGKLLWQVPLGEYEELTRQGVRKTGTENFGGPMVTAGGLVFCAGTRDRKIRAFDRATGEELWQYKLPYGGYTSPATYEVEGRQYVVIAATGGGKLGGERGDAYVAFALPRKSR